MRQRNQLLWVPAIAAVCLGTVLARPGAAQTQSSSGTTPTTSSGATVPLYRMPDVRRSLNITDQQVNRLNDAYRRAETGYNTEVGRLGDLSDRDRAARIIDLRRSMDTTFLRSAGDILNQNQMTRYHQLEVQRQGVNALSDPDVRRRLILTEDQSRRLADLARRYDRETREILRSQDRDAATRRYNDYVRDTRERVSAILNASQRRIWEQMTGQPYNFSPPFPTSNR